ncbi:MAG: PRC-barrel domain-containing protein [Gammaproteobacteria bacterium]
MPVNPQLLSATTLIGDEVRNLQDQDLGKIEDLMIDTRDGRVAYAVLSFGGFMGMADKLFAVPMDALELDTEDKCFVLDKSKEALKDAPGFDKHHWPDTASSAWQEQVRSYYGVEHRV